MSLRPRQYAAHLLTLKTPAERKAGLLEAPEEWRALVQKHGEIAWFHPQRKRQQEQTNNG